MANAEASPQADLNASVEYREHLAKVLDAARVAGRDHLNGRLPERRGNGRFLI